MLGDCLVALEELQPHGRARGNAAADRGEELRFQTAGVVDVALAVEVEFRRNGQLLRAEVLLGAEVEVVEGAELDVLSAPFVVADAVELDAPPFAFGGDAEAGVGEGDGDLDDRAVGRGGGGGGEGALVGGLLAQGEGAGVALGVHVEGVLVVAAEHLEGDGVAVAVVADVIAELRLGAGGDFAREVARHRPRHVQVLAVAADEHQRFVVGGDLDGHAAVGLDEGPGLAGGKPAGVVEFAVEHGGLVDEGAPEGLGTAATGLPRRGGQLADRVKPRGRGGKCGGGEEGEQEGRGAEHDGTPSWRCAERRPTVRRTTGVYRGRGKCVKQPAVDPSTRRTLH